MSTHSVSQAYITEPPHSSLIWSTDIKSATLHTRTHTHTLFHCFPSFSKYDFVLKFKWVWKSFYCLPWGFICLVYTAYRLENNERYYLWMESIIPQKHQHGIQLLRICFRGSVLAEEFSWSGRHCNFLPDPVCHWASPKLPPTPSPYPLPLHVSSRRVCHINCHPKSIFPRVQVTSKALLQRVCTDAELLTMCNTVMCSSWKTLH